MIYLDGEIQTIEPASFEEMPLITLEDLSTEATSRFTALIKNVQPGSLALDSMQYVMALGGVAQNGDARADFVGQDDFGRGRERSGNHVYFGQLVVGTEVTMDLPEEVAVKPMVMTGDKGLINEWAANNYLNSVSADERAYIPLGIWRDIDDVPQLVTVYDHPVQSYDNLYWATGGSARSVTPEKIYKAFGICMYGIGLLAGVGAIHGDAQPKNLAVDRKRFRYIDLEETTLLPRDGKGDFVYDSSTREQLMEDIDTFLGNCIGFGERDDVIVDIMGNTATHRLAFESYSRGIVRSAKRLDKRLPATMPITPGDIAEGFGRAVDMYNQHS